MKNIVIIGAGDLGKEVVWLIEDINRVSPTYVILGFLDDTEEKQNREFGGYRVLGKTEELEALNNKIPVCAVIAVQSGYGRKKISDAHPDFYAWENIIHPTATIAPSSTYGIGNIFFPQTVISAECKLGNFGIYYPQVTVGNDSLIQDYVSLFLRVSVDDHAEVEELAMVDASSHVPAHTVFKNRILTKLAIIGAGGFGRELASIIEEINNQRPTYEILGFLVDEKYRDNLIINGYPWLGNIDWALDHKENIKYICAIGDAKPRAQIQQRLMTQGVQFETIVAVGSYVGNYTKLGQGCVFYGGVMVSTNCNIGNGVLLNSNTTVGHDVNIGDYTTISPNSNVSGRCTIGNEVSIGGHSYIVPDKIIGNHAIIAAGSIVFTNVKEGTTVLGNPAKRMRELERV